MIGKSMRWERFSMKVNTDSRKVNTDSRKWGKSVHVQQESVFTFSRNGCSHWAGMGVQLQREYAASLDRLRHGAYRLVLDGESYRTPRILAEEEK